MICKTEEELQKLVQAVRNFSDDIHTEFGLDTFAMVVLKRGKLVHLQKLILDLYREIQQLEQGKYKSTYLGTEEN